MHTEVRSNCRLLGNAAFHEFMKSTIRIVGAISFSHQTADG
jgi:hypothetical protein